jgi:signal transduction histidine kinase
MESIDLFSMRERFNSQQIMLCFNGPISRSLIEEIGNALRNYLAADHAHPSAAMDVFAVYIEMTQNISHYTRTQGWSEQESGATVVVSRDDDGHYVVSAGNIIVAADSERLLNAVDSLAGLDKTQLKAAYKEQLRKPRDAEKSSGAGLGLIDIARKASQPLGARIQPISEGRSFFSLRAVI